MLGYPASRPAESTLDDLRAIVRGHPLVCATRTPSTPIARRDSTRTEAQTRPLGLSSGHRHFLGTGQVRRSIRSATHDLQTAKTGWLHESVRHDLDKNPRTSAEIATVRRFAAGEPALPIRVKSEQIMAVKVFS